MIICNYLALIIWTYFIIILIILIILIIWLIWLWKLWWLFDNYLNRIICNYLIMIICNYLILIILTYLIIIWLIWLVLFIWLIWLIRAFFPWMHRSMIVRSRLAVDFQNLHWQRLSWISRADIACSGWWQRKAPGPKPDNWRVMTNSGEASHSDPVPALRWLCSRCLTAPPAARDACLTLPVTSGGPGLALAIYKNSSCIMKFSCSLLPCPARHPRPPWQAGLPAGQRGRWRGKGVGGWGWARKEVGRW